MNRIKQINEHIAKADLIRGDLSKLDEMREIAREFVRMHNESPGSDEADELMHVILDGFDYDAAMRRVIAIKRHARLRRERKHRSQ